MSETESRAPSHFTFGRSLFDLSRFEIRMRFENESHTVDRVDRAETLIVARRKIISSIFFQFDIRPETGDEIVPLDEEKRSSRGFPPADRLTTIVA